MTTSYVAAGATPQWTLGDRLEKARKHAGMEKQDLAAAIGVSRNTIRNYEEGHTERFSRPTLIAWALATGVSLEWIETGKDSAPTPEGGLAVDDTRTEPTNPCLLGSAGNVLTWAPRATRHTERAA